MSINKRLPISAVSAATPTLTNLVLSWDTTQTSGTGSTGNLLALNGTSVTSVDIGTGGVSASNTSGSIDKSSSSNQDVLGNQGWGLSSSPVIESNVVLSHSSFFNTTESNWTLELWVKINSRASTSSVFVNSWQDAGAGDSKENFIIGLYGGGNANTTSNGTGFHTLVRSAVTTNYTGIGATSAPDYGNWIQAVFVADTSNVVLYVNGSSAGTVSAGGGLPQTSNQALRIGRRESHGSTGGWNGIFRICRMYKAALSASEILVNYNAEKAKFGLS